MVTARLDPVERDHSNAWLEGKGVAEVFNVEAEGRFAWRYRLYEV